MKLLALSISLSLLCGSAAHAVPPSTDPPGDGWRITFTPYVWATRVEGTMSIGGIETDFDVEFKDILADLDVALMGVLEARHDRWGFLVDGLGAVIKDDTTIHRPLLTIGAESRLREIVAQGVVLYRALSMPLASGDPRQVRIDLLTGLRYWNLKVELDLDSPLLGERSFEREADWVDPVVGTRILADLTDRLGLTFVGDVGGFGIGSASDFSWELWGLLRYGLTERSSLLFGYRALDVDRGRGNKEMDFTLHGPILGVSFHF